MKKYIILIASSLLLVNNLLAVEQPKVVATTTIIYDLTLQIGGDLVEVSSLVPVGGDPHLYEPIPQDAIKIVKANLILMNGLTLEGWLTEFIENSGTKAKVVNTTNGITPINSDAYANSPDPHAWMDAANGITYALNIKNALKEIDPNNAATYENNFMALKTRLEALDKNIREQISSIPKEKRILITSHDAFKYYGRKYGLQLESIQGISTEAQAQTSDISRLYKVIQESKIPAIFIESTINPQTLEQIAKDTKVKIGGKLFADSLGEPDGEAGTYEKMLAFNTKTIVDGLTGKGKLEEVAAPKETGGSSFPLYAILIAGLLIGGAWWMFRKM
jgi:ABC-type Zn uptake system ZnuABC Zn-binding protein ZnuA